jgi:hypothetical protein
MLLLHFLQLLEPQYEDTIGPIRDLACAIAVHVVLHFSFWSCSNEDTIGPSRD